MVDPVLDKAKEPNSPVQLKQNFCDASFTTSESLIEHIALCHDEKKFLECQICNVSPFSSNHEYNSTKEVLEIHNSLPNVCNNKIASNEFPKTEAINVKDRINDERDENYAAMKNVSIQNEKNVMKEIDTKDHNPASSQTLEVLKRYIENAQKNQKNLETKLTLSGEPSIEDGVTKEEGLNIAKPIREKKKRKKMECNICHKILNSSLKVHLSIVHEGVKPKRMKAECDICHKILYSSDMNRHIVTLHGEKKTFECEICNRCFAVSGKLKNHVMTVHEGRRPFECEICNRCFAQKDTLKKHVMTVHEGIKPFECEICNHCFAQNGTLKKHVLAVHKGIKLTLSGVPSIEDRVTKEEGLNIAKPIRAKKKRKKVKCNICHKILYSSLNLHIFIVHEGVKPKKKKAKCDICDKILYSKDMNRHIAIVHGEKKFECEICNFRFAVSGKLKNHVMVVHEGIKPFECEICNQCFAQNGTLKKHVLAVHEGKKPFKCEFCDTDFAHKVNMKKHVTGCKVRLANKSGQTKHVKLVHEGEKFKCQLCYKLFTTKISLKSHILTVHEKKKPYKCTYCDKEFSHRQSFILHVKNIICQRRIYFKCDFCDDGFSFKQDMLNHIESVHKEKPNFMCEVCSKSFFTASKLKNHNLKVHQEKPPVVCDICGDSLKTKQGLLQHTASVHQSKKPFTCESCGKSFVSKFSLNLHISRVHDGKKPFKCEFCDADFTQKGNMKKHVLYHHKPN